MSAENNYEALTQVESILKERESLFVQRERKLDEYAAKLKEVEKTLLEKSKEIQLANKELDAKREQLELDTKAFQLRLAEFEKKEKEHSKAILKSTILAEEVNNKNLQSSLDEEEKHMNDFLDALHVELGATATEILKEETGLDKLPLVDDISSAEQKADEMEAKEVKDAIPKILKQLNSIVEKEESFYVIELTESRLCVQKDEKEIRFFVNSDSCEVHIIATKQNTKGLQKNMLNLNRIQTTWAFSLEDNHMISRMSFGEKDKPEELLQKVSECIEKYFV